VPFQEHLGTESKSHSTNATSDSPFGLINLSWVFPKSVT
jgi:hypothetical protein